MATTPGILTEWPWQPLGSFKHIILAPWVIKHSYEYLVDGGNDLSSFLIFPLILWRMVHNQLWISLSRYRTAKGNNRIVDKPVDFDQLEREKNWDDQILLSGVLFYAGIRFLPSHLSTRLPIWRTDGIIMAFLIHAGPVEFLYYWFHRLLHHHFLYSRYHSHHHSSIVTEPITSVIHPFAEHIVYFLLFSIPVFATLLTGTASIWSFIIYVTYVDFMNNMGHCNFELFPKSLFTLFPPLKYLVYTPSFHSLHHTQFRTNYSLFMPFYDYIYGTMDKSTDSLYETSLTRQEDVADVVHLTHLTTPNSVYHLRFGFAHFASNPHTNKWYLWLLSPLTLFTMALTWLYGRTTFVVERHRFHKLNLQTWAIPKYTLQYEMKGQKEAINRMIEEAIVEADKKGVKVLSLGLLNSVDELMDKHGQLQVMDRLKTKVVDGTSLAVAVVVNTIPKGTTQLLLAGKPNKVASAVAFTLCQAGTQVAIPQKEEFEKLRESFGTHNDSINNLILSSNYSLKTWLVGEGLSEGEQKKAKAGTIFIPMSQFPPHRYRKDCLYYTTPAMEAPPSLENVDSCENWLPRRVMSAWRIAGIVHGLQGWKVDEFGSHIFNVNKIWEAALSYGFKPLIKPATAVSPHLS